MTDLAPFSGFRQILFWPLEIILAEDSKFDLDLIAQQIKDASPGVWQDLDCYDRRTTDDPSLRYAEYVYFHPFVQRFLYSGPSEKECEKGMRIFSRNDIRRVRVLLRTGWDTPPCEEVLDVDRVHLYLFQPHVAFLVVEVSAKREISRKSVLMLQDQLRRIYSPYFDEVPHSDGVSIFGGHCPAEVEWQDEHGIKKGDTSSYGDRDGALRSTEAVNKRRPPVSAHWRYLIHPLGDESSTRPLNFEHLEDDRMPAMNFLAHQEPFSLTRGDLMRLCFMDEVGASESLPYSKHIFGDFEEKYLYRRFWEPESDPDTWLTTLYMNCGFAFSMLVKAGFWSNKLLNDFRHHYFQMGLLAHFHRAALLRFSRRMSEVMLEDQHEEMYKKLRSIRLELAEFVNSQWFHEVSNQMQGRELFAWWSGHLGNEKLMADILAEASSVDEVLSSHRDDQQTDYQNDLNENVDRLTVVILWFTALALAVAVAETEFMKEWFASCSDNFLVTQAIRGGALVGLSALLVGSGYTLLWCMKKRAKRKAAARKGGRAAKS